MPSSILVVDDAEEAREALRYLLEIEGHSVVAVENGEEALRVLRSGESVGLVLLDLMMPVLDGWSFLAERARDPALSAIPVVVVSALEPRAPLDVTAHLSKPVDPEALLSLVERYCQPL